MSDWYASSAAYATRTAFVASHAYSIGDLVVPTAPAQGARWVFRCTTAGTSSTEPSWPTGNNATITTGGATFTNVTGQSTYFWTAAAGDMQTLNGTVGSVRYAAGDRTFVSSDHTETTTSGSYGSGNTIGVGYGLLQFICVNRAGSTPPAAADVTTGATVTQSSGTLFVNHRVNTYHSGFSFINTSAGNQITFNTSGTAAIQRTGYFQNCKFFLNNTNASSTINVTNSKVIFDNTTFQFGAAGQSFSSGNCDITWLNTPSAIPGATLPAVLFFVPSTNLTNDVTMRGVDLSAVTGTLVSQNGAAAGRYLFASCRIASGVTRYSNVANLSTADIVELVGCYDGTNIISESWQVAGTVSTELTIVLFGGAQDDVGLFSHKMVSGANVDKFANTLNGFWMDVEQAAVGSSHTATVEIISSASLNNDEIALYLEYQGTTGSSVIAVASSFIATPVTTPAAVPTSTATWNSSPATPQKQHMQVTFTPQKAGRLRGQVRLGKPSATVYVDPRITVT